MRSEPRKVRAVGDAYWPVVVLALLVSAAIYVRWLRLKRSGFFEQFDLESPVGLADRERVVRAWWGERYFGPLVLGSERTLGSWAKLLVRHLIPGRHWSRFQPALRLWGAPLQLKLTDRGRFVVMIARGWAPSLRPRVYGLGGGAGRGFEPLVAWGPDRRPRVRSAAEAFPDRSPGHFNRPDRQFISDAKDLTELIAIEPEDGDPLVAWCPEEVLPALRAWSGGA